MVLDPGSTTRHGLRRALTALIQVDARILGAVLNKTARTKDRYGYGYVSRASEHHAATFPAAVE